MKECFPVLFETQTHIFNKHLQNTFPNGINRRYELFYTCMEKWGNVAGKEQLDKEERK